MRREPEHFEGQELALVYIGKRLRDALALEDALTAAGIDYLVETDTYRGGVIFRTERVGAFFSVAAPDVEATHRVLVELGKQPYDGE